MKRIKLLLTFDYELPLGECDDYSVGLFNPADELLKVASQNEFPLVFFADICSAIRFREWDFDGYYSGFVRQLQNALILGNDVQLHIHPHWMDSSYINGRFFPSSNFSLSRFKEHQTYPIDKIIQMAFDELVAICISVKKQYQCVAFRAGGYDIEPSSKEILNKLNELGVYFESSVIKGLYLNNQHSKIDYRICPSGSRWHISRNGPVNKADAIDFLELPISSKPIGIMDLFHRRIKKIINRNEYSKRVYNNRGKGFHLKVAGGSIKNNFMGLFNPHVLSVDKVNYEVEDLERIIDFNMKSYANEHDDLILTLIGHPKSMGAYHRDLLQKFIDRMRAKYKSGIEFTTYERLFNQMRYDKKD